MFSLIITIIAIALVAALALATILYGGRAFHNKGAEAEATRVLNESQQIKGALTLYGVQTGGETVTSLDVLVAHQTLRQVPENWNVSEGFAYRPESQSDVCLASNKKIGINIIPTCADSTYANVAVCCSAPN